MGEEITCCFTGHRPHRLPWHEDELDPRCQRFRAELDRQVAMAYDRGYRHFISGMAQGVDMYAAEIVLELKKQHPQITLECAIPYERQAVRWPEALRNRYFSIAEHCDQETMLQTHYTQDCLWNRNRYMVDHADIVLAVCNMRLHSGSKQTVLMALRRLKPVWLVFPDTLELSVI